MTHTSTEQPELLPTPELLTKLQIYTEGGSILCSNYAGGYELLTEIWRVIVADEAKRQHARILELEAAQARRVPLPIDYTGVSGINSKMAFMGGWKAAERAHGITQEKQGCGDTK